MAKIFTRVIANNKHYSSITTLSRNLSNQVEIRPEICYTTDEDSKLSTLYVSKRHGADIYQIVKPVIDINYISDNLENLKFSCKHRGIHIDLENVLKQMTVWAHAKEEHSAFVQNMLGSIDDRKLVSSIDKTESFTESTQERDEVFKKINASKIKLYDIEDIVFSLVRKLPHVLHADTPLQSNVIDISHKPSFQNIEAKSHIDIAKHLLHFTDWPSTSYYVTGTLSELEFAIQLYFTDKLNHNEFLLLSCVDFCKSFILEAIGHDPYSSIKIKEKEDHKIGQKLHLVGAASFETFCAYLSNYNVNKSTFPVKYFSVGRRYNAANKGSLGKNLFSAVQSSNVHCMVISETYNFDAFDMLLRLIIECYTELNIPFRVVNIAAKHLTFAESHRKQVELWSPALKDYVPVAYVSQHDDFVSKRLGITYGIEHVKEGFCHITEGAFVNIPVLMGSIVENFLTIDNNFNIPNVIKKYIFS